ncbi:hypothetical protein AMECASPLE_013904 [Ameca splendens]|uniref:Uncharacterized protein n=1 Tax=Ameca splendens TaxID=208324 RepID=A0ABV1A7S5_9TELE
MTRGLIKRIQLTKSFISAGSPLCTLFTLSVFVYLHMTAYGGPILTKLKIKAEIYIFCFSFSLHMPLFFLHFLISLFPLPYAFLLHYANEEGCLLLSSSSTIGQ